MTSNLGTEDIGRQPFGFRPDAQNAARELRESVDAALKRAFRPEFLNRVDETIVFQPLTREQIVEIVQLMVNDVKKRLEDRDVSFELTQDAASWLAKEGFDPVYGARPLRRMIQRQLENPLARSVLSGDLEPGAHLVVDAGPEGLTITPGPPSTESAPESTEPVLV